MHYYSSIPNAIEELKKGNMLIVVDDKNRENQADIIFPAATITEKKVNFLMKECRGMFCVPMTAKRAAHFAIPLMIPQKDNTEKLHCNFTITVDSKNVTSHGISAFDRMLTVRTLLAESSKPDDFLRPGHVCPLIAQDGGVLTRDGHTEAAIDLAKLAGFPPIAVLSEIIDDEGKVMQGDTLLAFAKKHKLIIITIPDLIAYQKTSLPHAYPHASV